MIIDLRSDTVTKPDAGMREAMARAEVGDAVFGEDPTVNELEARVASLFGKDDALFVPSGIMANQIALHSHTRPGDEILVDSESHIFNHEGGAASLLSGVQTRAVNAPGGQITPELLQANMRLGLYGEPRSALLCLENTHNRRGGLILNQLGVIKTTTLARDNTMSCHLDGARIWNASVATGVPVDELVASFDSVSACLSKGLGAPVGSVLAGSHAFMKTARRFRHILGGNMRQAGIIAAAGLYALENNLADLEQDHIRARRMAEILATLPGIHIDLDTIQTNIIMFKIDGGHARQLVTRLAEKGVLLVPFGPDVIRITLHRDVDDAQIERALEIVKDDLVDNA